MVTADNTTTAGQKARPRKSVAFTHSETTKSKSKTENANKQRRIIVSEAVASPVKRCTVEADLDIANQSIRTPTAGVEEKHGEISKKDDATPRQILSYKRDSAEKREISPGTCSRLKLARGEKRNRLRYTEVCVIPCIL